MAHVYVMSPWTGRVYAFDGAQWNIVGGGALSGWNASTWDVQACLFVFQGYLVALYNNGATSIRCARLSADGTTWSLAWTGSRASNERYGNAIPYKGQVFVLEGVPGATVFPLVEMTGSSIQRYTGISGVRTDRATVNNFVHNSMTMRMVPYRDRLLLGQFAWGSSGLATDTEHLPNTLYLMDLKSSGVAPDVTKVLGGPGGANGTLCSITEANSGYLDAIVKTHVGFGVYRGHVYLVGTDSGVRHLDVATGTVTEAPIFTFQAHASMQLTGLAADAANPHVDGLIVSGSAYDAISSLIIGATITCDGRTGVVTGVSDTVGPYLLYLRDPVTKAAMGNFPTAAGFDFQLGMGLNNQYAGDRYNHYAHAYAFELAGKFYVLIGGRTLPVGPSLPCLLAEWDGVSVRFLQLTFQGSTPDCAGMVAVLDDTTGLLHVIFGTKAAVDMMRMAHLVINAAAMTQVAEHWCGPGAEDAYDSSQDSSNNGMPCGIVACFHPGTPGSVVLTTTLDPGNGKVTIEYRLHAPYADPPILADVSIQSDYGNGWFECSRKGTEGEGKTGLTAGDAAPTYDHVFVHDVTADGPPPSWVQYRVIARPHRG